MFINVKYSDDHLKTCFRLAQDGPDRNPLRHYPVADVFELHRCGLSNTTFVYPQFTNLAYVWGNQT